MLEVLQVRAIRREPLQVVVTAHLIGEFLAQLAWESTLGHGGDPLYLADFVGGSRWGTDDPVCAHSSSQRSTAHRALNACSGRRGRFHHLPRSVPLPAGRCAGRVCDEPRHRSRRGRATRRGGVLPQSLRLRDQAADGASARPGRPGPVGADLRGFPDRGAAAPRPGRATSSGCRRSPRSLRPGSSTWEKLPQPWRGWRQSVARPGPGPRRRWTRESLPGWPFCLDGGRPAGGPGSAAEGHR